MGYYGVGNLGDEMMLYCLKPWLEKQGFQVSVLSERPAEVSKADGLAAIENWPLLGQWSWYGAWIKGGALRLIRAIAQSDALIVGGGDLIRDDMGWKTLLYTIEKMVVALLLRKKIYVVNAGIGKLSTWYGRILLQWTLRRCRRIIVRDLRSAEICREFGVKPDPDLAPDIVLSLPDLLNEESTRGAECPVPQPYVVVSLRHNPNAFRKYEMTEERIRTLAASLDDLIERNGVEVVFLPMQAGFFSGRGDNQLHGRVVKAMVRKDRVHVRAWTSDLREICRWIQGARFVIAMRLHAAVLAFSCGRPSVLMPYDRKIREFSELMKIELLLEENALNDRAAVSFLFEEALSARHNVVKKCGLGQDVSRLWEKLSLDFA
jgi:polysaccharide pyruvyl transferase CsaB